MLPTNPINTSGLPKAPAPQPGTANQSDRETELAELLKEDTLANLFATRDVEVDNEFNGTIEEE